MTLREYLGALSQDLNDLNPPGSLANRWSQSQLLRYLNEGLCHVFTLSPKSFLREMLVELEPGNLQKICADGILHKVLGQTDETGLVIKPLPERNEELMVRWAKKVCSSSRPQDDFSLSGYTFNKGDAGYFTVYPAVPPNEQVFVKVLFMEKPKALSLSDLDSEINHGCTTMNAARQWALYSALAVDDESAAAVNAAKGHIEVFFQLMKVQADQRLLQEFGVNQRVARAYAAN